MTARTPVPALGAEGWFTLDDAPTLIGSRCTTCGTFAFPPGSGWCPNPGCRGTELIETPLSQRGRIWSYTDAQYRPPAPFVSTSDEFEQFGIAAVTLEREGLMILGQLVPGVGVDDVAVGDEVEVVLGTLFSDDDHDYLTWRWKPTGGAK